MSEETKVSISTDYLDGSIPTMQEYTLSNTGGVPANSTVNSNLNGSLFANTVTASAAPVHYVTGGGWYGVTPPPSQYIPDNDLPLTTGDVYAHISPADVERIADAVLAKIEQKLRTRKGHKVG